MFAMCWLLTAECWWDARYKHCACSMTKTTHSVCACVCVYVATWVAVLSTADAESTWRLRLSKWLIWTKQTQITFPNIITVFANRVAHSTFRRFPSFILHASPESSFSIYKFRRFFFVSRSLFASTLVSSCLTQPYLLAQYFSLSVSLSMIQHTVACTCVDHALRYRVPMYNFICVKGKCEWFLTSSICWLISDCAAPASWFAAFSSVKLPGTIRTLSLPTAESRAISVNHKIKNRERVRKECEKNPLFMYVAVAVVCCASYHAHTYIIQKYLFKLLTLIFCFCPILSSSCIFSFRI